MLILASGLLRCAVLLCSMSASASMRQGEMTLLLAANSVESLTEAERLFEVGRFVEAAQLVDSLVATEENLGAEERARAYLLKARLSVAFERRDEMLFWLGRLAPLGNLSHPDPMRDPPELMEGWRRAKESSAAPSKPQVTPAPAARATPAPSSLAETTLGKIDVKMRQNARFWVGLGPFGIGHFSHGLVWEGAAFATSEIALLLVTSGLGESAREAALGKSGPWESKVGDRMAFESDRESAYSLLGVFGFLGLWGYELHSMLPELADSQPAGSELTRFALSFAPFGVGQMKNGEGLKAAGFASAELTLLLLSGTLPRQSQRQTAQVLFWGSLLGGAVDGWLNHNWDRPVSRGDVWRFRVGIRRDMPVLSLTYHLGDL